jgi:hypothetical protein
MLKTKNIFFLLVPCTLCLIAFFNNSCNIYKFRDISIPDSIKTVKVGFFDNRAPYVNPQLSPRLADKLRQKIVSQTRLSQTNNDNADWDITGTVTDYSFSTSGISNQQSSSNRISVAVHIILNDQKAGKMSEYDVSRNFDFSSTQSLQQAEASLLEEMLRGLSDDIFNRIFSNW